MIAIFTSALGRALSKQEKAFVDLLLKNGRINALPSILALFSANEIYSAEQSQKLH
jgi:F0F1-type ATP synthase delta subunit